MEHFDVFVLIMFAVMDAGFVLGKKIRRSDL